MAKQATNIRLFTAEQIPHPGANQQKANARPWEQVQLKMPDKRPGGGGWAAMELIETLYRPSFYHPKTKICQENDIYSLYQIIFAPTKHMYLTMVGEQAQVMIFVCKISSVQ